MSNQWFYARDGQKYGPVSSKRLKELATIGVVRRNDLIWSPGYSVWRPAKKFRGLLPKMDATSLSPAMSLFWKPDQAEDQNADRFKGLLLEPNSPATAVTPPLPAGFAKKPAGSAPAGSSASTNGGRSTATAAARPATKRPSAAALAEPASAPTSSAAVARPSAQASPKRPEPTVTTVTKTKGKWGGLSSKEKLAIGGGILVLLLIYGVLLLRVL